MHIRWLAIAAAIILIIACFFPWVTIESRQIVISGVEAKGTSFGRPGYLHLLFGGLTIFLLLFQKTWAVRTSIFLVGFNVAWSLRNFFLISACYSGECPQKHPALYVIVLSSVALIILTLFTSTKVTGEQPET